MADDWTVVPGCSGRYEVTSDGRIRNAKSLRPLRPMAAESGHLYILFRDGVRSRKLFVHRAVLLTFVGPPRSGQETRHLNGRETDNRIENLAWGTRLENVADKVTHGTQARGEQIASAKLTPSQVAEIRVRVPGETLRALAAEYGVSHTAIRRAANGMKWAHLEPSHVR